MPAAVRAWRAKGDLVPDTSQEDFGIEVDEDDDASVSSEIVRNLGALPSFDVLRNNDTKFATLAARLSSYFRDNPNDKVVLFSSFLATLEYLRERLAELGISSIVLSGAHGIDQI